MHQFLNIICFFQDSRETPLPRYDEEELPSPPPIPFDKIPTMTSHNLPMTSHNLPMASHVMLQQDEIQCDESRHEEIQRDEINPDESNDDETLPLVQWTNNAEITANPVNPHSIYVNPGLRLDQHHSHIQVNHETRYEPNQNNPFNADIRIDSNPVRQDPLPRLPGFNPQHDEEPKYARVDLRTKRTSKHTDSREGTPVRLRRRG